MKNWRAMVVMALGLLGAAGANAQNLLLNPSFEAGTANWVDSGAPCSWEPLTPPATTSQFGAWDAPPPTDGNVVLLSDAGAPGTCTFSQDVVAPATGKVRLTFDAGYNYTNFGNAAGPGCSASVGIFNEGQTAIAYGAHGGVNQPLRPREPLIMEVKPGTTVTVVVTTNSCTDGPAGIVLDNVVLAASTAPIGVPTLGEWAKIILAILMAGSAALFLRRRRVR